MGGHSDDLRNWPFSANKSRPPLLALVVAAFPDRWLLSSERAMAATETTFFSSFQLSTDCHYFCGVQKPCSTPALPL